MASPVLPWDHPINQEAGVAPWEGGFGPRTIPRAPSGGPLPPLKLTSYLPLIRSCPNDLCPYVTELREGGWRFFAGLSSDVTTCPHCQSILEERR